MPRGVDRFQDRAARLDRVAVPDAPAHLRGLSKRDEVIEEFHHQVDGLGRRAGPQGLLAVAPGAFRERLLVRLDHGAVPFRDEDPRAAFPTDRLRQPLMVDVTVRQHDLLDVGRAQSEFLQIAPQLLVTLRTVRSRVEDFYWLLPEQVNVY